MRLRTSLLGLAATTWVTSAWAVPATPKQTELQLAAGETSQVKPADEKAMVEVKVAKPVGTHGQSESTSKGRPLIHGERIPEELRGQMRAMMDARIDKDLVEIRGIRTEAIDLLTHFLAETPRDAPEMPEAMMRLGELKWEAERDGFLDRFKAWEARPVDQRGPAPEPNLKISRDLFSKVLTDYPWFREYDLALYADGFLATQEGKEDEALARFERILREYPNSRFTPDAHMIKGETLLSQKYDFQGALTEYEAVLKYPETDLYGLALFKSAWCLWRLGQTDAAAERFVQVFGMTNAPMQPGKASGVRDQKQLDELQAESLKYFVEVLTEDEKNKASDAYAILAKVKLDRLANKVVPAVAAKFFDEAHYERGIEAYELLLKLDPTNREAGDWILQIAAGYYTLEDYPRLKATYERALTDYTTGGAWARTQADPANVAATTTKIEQQLREHALALHGKAQHDKTSRAEYEATATLYDVYLSRFSSDPTAFEIQYYEGEVDFYHLGRMTDAATHYEASAKTMPPDKAKLEPWATQRKDALRNALAALGRVRADEFATRKGKGALGETETDKKFAEVLSLYSELYPDAPDLPELLFRQGKLYYDYKVYDSAVKLWGTLLEKFPSSQFAPPAGELVLDSFNKANDYDNIETWARRLKTARGFESPTQQGRLDALIVQAVFKKGEQKGAANDHLGAAAAYLRAAKEFPKDQRAAQACVNAELEAQKAGDIATLKEAAVLATGKEYRDRPESPLGAWTAATTLQSMGMFADAAEFDEIIASFKGKEHPHYAKYEHLKDAAFNAVLLRVATHDHDRAIADGNNFLRDFPSAAEADEVAFQMGKADQNAGQDKEAVQLYQRYLPRAKNLDHRVEGYVLLAQAQMKVGDDKGAAASLAMAVSLGKHRGKELSADGKYAAAHARYMEGERVLARFEAIQIGGDVKQLGVRLKQKAALLKEAAQVFLDTVSLGVADWSTAALYQIGHTYELFAKSLRDAPPPSGLSDADKDAYSSQIETFAVPVEERSLDAYENGWKKAMELGIYNQWTAKMREALGRLNGELYPPMHEIGFDVRSASTAPMPPLIDSPRRAVPKAGKP